MMRLPDSGHCETHATDVLAIEAVAKTPPNRMTDARLRAQHLTNARGCLR